MNVEAFGARKRLVDQLLSINRGANGMSTKVAIVGSGLAGLTAVWRLTEQENVEVHLFEKVCLSFSLSLCSV